MIDAPAGRHCEPAFGTVVVLRKDAWDQMCVVEAGKLARPIEFALKRGAGHPDMALASDRDRRFNEGCVMEIALRDVAELMLMPLPEPGTSHRQHARRADSER